MSLKKRNQNKRKTTFLEQQIRSIDQIRRKKIRMTAEDINLILEKHFTTLELIKFNLFGEDFENYGKIEINGQIYYPYKLSLDYLAKQQSDDAKLDFNINVDILNSLKKADDINKINLINFKRSSQKKMTTSRHNQMLRNKSMEDIKINKFNKPVNNNKVLPKKSYHNPHAKLNFVDNYMKYILLKKFNDPISNLNNKDVLLRKTSYLKRHNQWRKLNNKLNLLENKFKNIDNQIKNDMIINKDKNPQFQFRYKYVESKFKI